MYLGDPFHNVFSSATEQELAQGPPSPVGVRLGREEEAHWARTGLAVLDELQTGLRPSRGLTRELSPQALFDPRLLAVKEALKPYPPVLVQCSCTYPLEYIALAPLSDHGLQLNRGPKLRPGQHQGGALDILSGVRSSPMGETAALGTTTWATDSDAGVGNSRTVPDGEWGKVYGLKADYKCPALNCGRPATILHVTMLRLWLNAVIRDDLRVQLPSGWDHRGGVTRIADRGSAKAWSTSNRRRSSRR